MSDPSLSEPAVADLPAGRPVADAQAVGAPRLVRDRLTLTLYGYSVMWGWWLYSFTPGVPLIAEDLGITRAQAGLHGTFMAGGMIAAGLFSAQLVGRVGRRTVLLIGPALIVGGVAMLVAGQSLAVTLPAVTVVAIGGSLAISAFQPALAVHHGGAGAAALTEANGAGALVGLVGPLALGLSVSLGGGWRPAVAITVVLAAGVALAVSRLPATGALGRPTRTVAVPDADPATGGRRGFSPAFWLFWIALVCAIGIENATTFWAADLLQSQTGATAGLAAGAVSGLVAGMAAARFAVGRLALRLSPVDLLLGSFALAAVGWFVLWSATSPVVGLVGLVVAGLGYGAQYPLTIVAVLDASAGRPDAAQSRSTLAGGVAVGVAPPLLGALADAVGTRAAFGVVPVLVAIAALTVTLARRWARATGDTSIR
ncbi:MFS transporter [Cellulomonas sp. P22]|uniref:MFS transporter n=1 Tax=Cellulomonas sp. P22 TaxID=3373189 RepID=UPI0037B4AA1C